MEFLNQCELLKIEDILPFFQDFVTIDHFKVSIPAPCLSLLETLIVYAKGIYTNVCQWKTSLSTWLSCIFTIFLFFITTKDTSYIIHPNIMQDVTTNPVNMTYARHESPSSSVIRESDRSKEGHGFDSHRGLNGASARWHHLTTATRILHVVVVCCKLGPLFVKPHWDYEIEFW